MIHRYLCPKCDQNSITMNNMTRHLNAVHSDSRDFKCQDCPATFTRKGHLTAHINSHHTADIQCRHCPKILRDMRTLKQHYRNMHRDITPFPRYIYDTDKLEKAEIRVSIPTQYDLYSMSSRLLKQKCQAFHLSQEGTKNEQIERLQQYIRDKIHPETPKSLGWYSDHVDANGFKV